MRIDSRGSLHRPAWAVALLLIAGITFAQTDSAEDSAKEAATSATAPENAAGEEAGQPAQAPATAPAGDDADFWREVGGADNRPGKHIRTSTIRVNEDGMLHGSLFRIDHETREQIVVKQMEVTLIRDGEEVETTTPSEEDGTFQFGPVQAGIYSIIGQGEDGFVAFSFHVQLPDANEAGAADAEADAEGKKAADAAKPNVEMIHSSALDPRDVRMALELIHTFAVPAGDQGGRSAVDIENMIEDAKDAAADEPEMELPAEAAPRKPFVRAAEAIPQTTLSWHTVRLQPEGNLIGRILKLEADDREAKNIRAVPPKDMQVFIVNDGRVISRATCNELGNFSAPDLKPDIYSLIAVGADGFGALTVEVLPAVDEQPEGQDGEQSAVKSASIRRIAFQQPVTDDPTIYTTTVPPEASQFVQEIPPINIPQTEPLEDFAGLTGGFPGGGNGGNSGSPSGGSGLGTVGGGGLSAPSGGSGGGAGGGGGGGNNRTNQTNVPEIDPATSGVGLSVLIALLLLLIDLYRPR